MRNEIKQQCIQVSALSNIKFKNEEKRKLQSTTE